MNNNNNNNISRIHPDTTQLHLLGVTANGITPAVGGGGGGGGTPLIVDAEGSPMIGNTAQHHQQLHQQQQQQHNLPRESLMQDTNNTNVVHQFSSPTNKSTKLNLNRYMSIELLKKQFLTLYEEIPESRLVEILGGLASVQAKQQAIVSFGRTWSILIGVLESMEEKITELTYEVNCVYPNSDQLVSELLFATVKEIESRYLDLICQSALRFLDTVCTVHDLQYKQYIHIRFDARQWRKNIESHIKQTQASLQQQSKESNGGSSKNNGNKPRSQSLIARICGSCAGAGGGGSGGGNSGLDVTAGSQNRRA